MYGYGCPGYGYGYNNSGYWIIIVVLLYSLFYSGVMVLADVEEIIVATNLNKAL